MNTELSGQVTVALAVSLALQWLKGQKWFPLVNYNTEKLNRAVSLAVAFLSGIGILATFDSASGVLTVHGLTLANLGHIASHGLEQYLMQHAAYKGLIAPPEPGAKQDAARKLNGSGNQSTTSPPQPPAS